MYCDCIQKGASYMFVVNIKFDIFLVGINYPIRCRRMGNLLRLLHAKSDEKEDKDIFIDFESMLILV